MPIINYWMFALRKIAVMRLFHLIHMIVIGENLTVQAKLKLFDRNQTVTFLPCHPPLVYFVHSMNITLKITGKIPQNSKALRVLRTIKIFLAEYFNYFGEMMDEDGTNIHVTSSRGHWNLRPLNDGKSQKMRLYLCFIKHDSTVKGLKLNRLIGCLYVNTSYYYLRRSVILSINHYGVNSPFP